MRPRPPWPSSPSPRRPATADPGRAGPTLTLPRIIAHWGEHLYSHEADAVRQADAALSELTLPPGPITVPPVTVPPGTITPGSGPEE
jgi:hypothetical protein